MIPDLFGAQPLTADVWWKLTKNAHDLRLKELLDHLAMPLGDDWPSLNTIWGWIRSYSWDAEQLKIIVQAPCPPNADPWVDFLSKYHRPIEVIYRLGWLATQFGAVYDKHGRFARAAFKRAVSYNPHDELLETSWFILEAAPLGFANLKRAEFDEFFSQILPQDEVKRSQKLEIFNGLRPTWSGTVKELCDSVVQLEV